MVGQELTLLSIAGAEPVTYKWPLILGKGSIRGAEDDHDQANEIMDSIRWVCEDHPEVHTAVGHLLHSYDRNKYESMARVVDVYNTAVKELLEEEGGKEKVDGRLGQRPSRIMLKHILQQVYNTAISDPNDLNHYEPFTPEVYGETSFDLINQMIDLISPITSEMKFIDLGSGVGQVVLQVAALIDCQLCVGIEKAKIPSDRAVTMDILFKRWMSWYGKKYSQYKLYQGDFLGPEHRATISSSTIVFVNNFAFGPEVDHMLKDRFADLKDGARIVSSKPFCPLNFRITERNLSDIGTIMHVSVMDPLKGSVSWTDKPVSYYLHQIDSSKLERYFIRQQSHNTRNSRSNRHLLDGDASSNGSWAVSRDSRASSVEKEVLDPDSPHTLISTNSAEEDSDPTLGPRGKPRARGRPSKKKFTKKRHTPRPEPRVAKVSQFLDKLEVNMAGEEGLATGTPDTESLPTSRSETPPMTEEGASDTVASSRPVRAAVVNAAAISEAQAEILSSIDAKNSKDAGRRTSKMRGRGKYKHLNEGDRLPRSFKTAPGLGPRKKSLRNTDMEELEAMHQAALKEIEDCNETKVLPTGCMDERLDVQEPMEMTHEDLPLHVYTADGQQIPYGLHVLLESMKRSYLKMVENMQGDAYAEGIQEEVEREKERKEQLTRRVKQLENQIDNLIQDSLGLLKARLRELGINATAPTDFIERAKGIVCSHNDLQKKRGGLEAEIRRLEDEQEQLIARKEKEILDSVLASRHGSKEEVNLADLRARVKSDIRACLEEKEGRDSPLPKVGSDVTLTKVPGEKRRSGTEEVEVRRIPSSKVEEEARRREEESRKRAEEEFGRMREDEERRRRADEVRRRGEEESRRREEEVRRKTEESRKREAELSRKTSSEHSGPSSQSDLKKTMAAPRAQDDYEDRFKKIITSELGREREINKMPLEGGRAVVRPTSPGKPRGAYPDPRELQDPRAPPLDPRTSFIPGRGPPKDSRQMNEPRLGPDGRPLDPRPPRGPPVDPRALMDPRDPRALIDPRALMDHRTRIDPRALMDPRGPPDPRLGPGSDPRGVLDIRGPPQEHRAPTDPRDGRSLPLDHRGPPDPRMVPGRPPAQDPRLVSPQDPRARPDSHGSSHSGEGGKRERSVADHISSEIERSLMGDGKGKIPSSSSSSSSLPVMSSQQMINMSVERAIHNHNSAARLSKVIEDSVRKDAPPEKTSIYATNKPSSTTSQEQPEGLACPRGSAPSPQGIQRPLGAPLPQVEGLASRFDSFFEKEKAASREGFAGRFSSPDITTSRPTSTGSKSSLHTPDPGDAERKRAGSPLPSPGTSKHRREVTSAASSTSGGDAKGSGGDEARRMQDEISMGFDRLIAMASEVDKRRKSAENSPVQDGNSPRKGASDLRLPESQDSMAKKFKAGLLAGEGTSGRRDDKEHSSFPGDKLPEHHFKKKYFNAEFQRQQGEQERREGRGREDEEERRRVSQSSGGPPRDHRYEQAMRAHFEGQARPPGPAGHQEQVGGPRPQGPHFRGVPYSETPRQRPQMFPGGPQGYPGPPQGPQDQGRGDFGPRGHPMGPHHRGPPPPQGPQGYPGPPHYNPQQAMAMQAMAYRHQMMYGRPPHPGPPKQ